MARTVMELLRAAAGHLSRRGSDEARLDAELLLAEVLGKSRLGLYLVHDMPVEEELIERYREFIRRRARGEPTAYLLGRREFFGLEFQVDRRVLVPRPETEILVEAAVQYLKNLALPAPRVLDLGTGSGCIAIAVARNVPGSVVVATDVSPEALAVARANAVALAEGCALSFRLGDLFGALRPGDAPFDLVLSNPPYVTDAERSSLATEVRDFEPAQALFSGSDAFAFHRRILDAAPEYLAPHGRVMLECGAGVAGALGSFMAAVYPGRGFEVVRDLSGRERHLSVASGARSAT